MFDSTTWGLRARMVLVMTLLGAVTIGFGAFLGLYFQNIAITAVFVGALSIIQLLYGHKIALRSFNADVVDAEDYPELHQTVTRLSQQADLPKPDVAVADTALTNAFAAGRSTDTAVVCVTTGLMETLDDDELEAVLAHELAHIKNRDMVVMTAAGTLAAIASYVTRWGWYYGDRGRNVPVLAAIGVAAVTWVLSFLLVRLLSRYREFAADRGAAAITGNPHALASALRTIDDSLQEAPDEDLRDADGLNTLMIAGVETSRLTKWFSTHPATEDRIERLRDLSDELNS